MAKVSQRLLLRVGGALAIALTLSHPAQALDLLQAWNLTEARAPSYAASQAGRQAEQEQVPQARSNLLPQIQAQAGGEQLDRRQTSKLSKHNNSQRATWSLSLSQSIVDRSAWYTLDQAQLQAQAADVQLAQTRQDLMLTLSQAYFDVLAAQDNLQTLHAQRDAILTQLRAAEQMFELGGSTITDTYEAQSRLDLVRAQIIHAENELRITQDTLQSLTQEPAQNLAALRSEAVLPQPEPNNVVAWTEQASLNNLEVHKRALLAEASAKKLASASAEHEPTLALKAQTGSASDQALYGQQGGSRSLNSSVGLELSIPLYTGGRTSSLIREQSSRMQQARHEHQQARLQAIQDSQRYYSGLHTGFARIQALAAAEHSSKLSVEANQLGYEVGVRINIDVLNAQQQLYQTQRDLAKARYDTVLNGLRLKASTGALNETDLQAVNDMLEAAP
ncbi:TolC family outer membrane protein [Alcaligenes endophyticus]|uniref:TolC family outer membrane protein n=1 Tax=Alcaligenes endophyticus TaxID=1929088 RepID=A0ABT8EG28_9BURK|nr:TolC family outer membrane protein [Alcaligenes endophyticus]MCX5590098.1 TolC family outer membrane protein [Alcaligenes endophyticus]MDN4120239.1 TolC family outer membrane protein [Alcaligenes endophyticus]